MKRMLALMGLTVTAACVNSSQLPVQTPPSELAVEAGVWLNNGDIRRAAARMPLTLLDADFGALLTSGTRQNMKIELMMWRAMRSVPANEATDQWEPEMRVRIESYEAFLKQHTVATATTDFDGKAIINAAPGKYFLFAFYDVLQNTVVWNLPVQLPGRRTTLVLDNGNMTP